MLECCCNCKYQFELFKHPWNKVNKGSIMESTNMYACTVQHEGVQTYQAVLHEDIKGLCEMFTKKD